jgi:hypothetical protein
MKIILYLLNKIAIQQQKITFQKKILLNTRLRKIIEFFIYKNSLKYKQIKK